MGRWLKIGTIVLGSLAALLALSAVVLWLLAQRHIDRTYDVAVAVPPPSFEATVERGKHVATIRGCTDCHAADFGGRVMIETAAVGRISGPNLTTGRGGVAGEFSDEDFVRAVRHGIGRNGRSLWIMPSQEYWHLSDDDTAALLAYVRSLPPVDRELPPSRLALPLRAIFVLQGTVALFPAELIDHTAQRPQPPRPGDVAALGQYLAVTCVGCHGEHLSGGEIPGMPPEWPAASNLTPAGSVGNWTLEQFAAALRTGRTPDGRRLDEKFMPWRVFGAMTDAEIEALWLYIRSVPPRPDGTR